MRVMVIVKANEDSEKGVMPTAWLKKAPFDGGTEIEVRPIFEAGDFGAEFTPELREQEDRLRAQIAARQQATS